MPKPNPWLFVAISLLLIILVCGIMAFGQYIVPLETSYGQPAGSVVIPYSFSSCKIESDDIFRQAVYARTGRDMYEFDVLIGQKEPLRFGCS